MQNKKVAVVLSGCGVFDGTEIFEATLTLLRLDQLNCNVQCFAPDIMQHHVLDHRTGDLMPEQRNVLTEAARINRGNVHALAEANANDFDALIIPGGFGVAKNLSTFAFSGTDCEVNAEFSRLVQQFHQQKKPIGMICIAPTLLPKILGPGVSCTIGHDAATAGKIDEMGGLHIGCDVDNIVIDYEHKVITTPAYMEATRISEAAVGISKLVDKVIDLS
ncbi:Enhancing lycopene biosynthesis protein 2 [Oceanospirillum multiglobuliferum]|uniref:Glyoxalase n=1 Tax=Oceanospirillum multiglobuliferum TaxID=64969 RepID=A0A1T4S352_9GAMM|nr:isoprenoid biosynthesis glyoxalase ElbB [Oceanospirillum multiglobuliferum]OPX54477.1 isoprenoid biosynthesis protein ElbB [Oceanospirillum multiglobuliferum]SKA22378.1 Enhancing lycopene biosynthesis protein 2 [Oceanospirillum multiglobuliferum]